MNININDIKNGMTVVMDGNLCVIQEFQHVKPGKGPAFVRIKLKNLKTGSTVEDTYNTNIKIQKAHIDKVNVQFLYAAGDVYTFMNNETYEQIEVPVAKLADNAKFIKEGLDITIDFYEGEIIGITLPEKIEYKDMFLQIFSIKITLRQRILDTLAMKRKVKVLVVQSCLILQPHGLKPTKDLWDLFMGFSRQEYWSG